MQQILVIDDDEDMVWAVSKVLSFHGYAVRSATHAEGALHQLQQPPPALVLLDVVMPDIDGVELCARLRNNPQWRELPVIFLTGLTELRNKIAAYTVGADDYLVKPFDMQELLLRVRAVLRRAHGEQAPPAAEQQSLQIGPFRLNMKAARVETARARIALTPNELNLLQFLMQHTGQIFSSEALLQQVWAYPPGTGDPALVRWHIKNLRRKLEPSAQQETYLRTVPHHGYTFALPELSPARN